MKWSKVLLVLITLDTFVEKIMGSVHKPFLYTSQTENDNEELVGKWVPPRQYSQLQPEQLHRWFTDGSHTHISQLLPTSSFNKLSVLYQYITGHQYFPFCSHMVPNSALHLLLEIDTSLDVSVAIGCKTPTIYTEPGGTGGIEKHKFVSNHCMMWHWIILLTSLIFAGCQNTSKGRPVSKRRVFDVHQDIK